MSDLDDVVKQEMKKKIEQEYKSAYLEISKQTIYWHQLSTGSVTFTLIAYTHLFMFRKWQAPDFNSEYFLLQIKKVLRK